jgi:hypothetical protein
MNGDEAAMDDAEALRCDLCGVETGAVQRVALDRGYERLATRHTVQYACQSCHERKDRQRLGIERG